MKRDFEVWGFDFPGKGEHPVVLISHPDRCARATVVNVLFCTSQRQSRPPYPFEVMLDENDGLDWETFCDCSVIYAVHAEKLHGRRGRIAQERRNAIRAKLLPSPQLGRQRTGKYCHKRTQRTQSHSALPLCSVCSFVAMMVFYLAA